MKISVVLALLLSLPAFADKVVKTSSSGKPPKAVKDYADKWNSPVLLYSGPEEDIYVANLQNKKKNLTAAVSMQDYGSFLASLYTFYKNKEACLRERFTEAERALPAATATCNAQPIFLRKVDIQLAKQRLSDIHTAGILADGSIDASTAKKVKGQIAFAKLPPSLIAAIDALHALAAPFYPAIDLRNSEACSKSIEFAFDGDHGVEAPKVTYQPDPAYTTAARKAKFHGDTRIRLMVDADGSVKCARIIQPLPYGLDEEALKAVSAYRFKPATQYGKPVAVDLLVQVQFRIF